MRVQEITTKTALVRSRIPGVRFVINPYLGCGHACRYCYATFMRQYSRHHAAMPWGTFVEVKINIADVLHAELRSRKKTGTAMLASVCDPYQPVERRYKLTRQCLELLKAHGWGIHILTRSPLVLRDLDILTTALDISVGLSIPTDDDRVRHILEPEAPPIGSRVATLKRLAEAGLKPWVFIAPMLPMNPARLYELLAPHADHVLMDPLNYIGQVAGVFRRYGWDYALTRDYAEKIRADLGRWFGARAAAAEATGYSGEGE